MSNLNKVVKKVADAIFLAMLVVSLQSVAHAGSKPPAHISKLDNATCLSCHSETSKLETKDADGNKRPLYAVDHQKFGKSVHSEMECIACHKEITDDLAPHKKTDVAKVGCVQCHLELWDKAKADNLTKEKARLGVVVTNIGNYMESFHARPNAENASGVNAHCDDCHNTHTFNVPSQGTTRRTEWHLTIPNVCGEKCHSDELEEYTSSVHGQKVLGEHNQKAAVCTDCHTTHDIGNTSKVNFKTGIIEKCGTCHEENLKSYRSTYHGQVNKLGYGYTAKCYDCHGSHGILSPKDPDSKVNIKNRLKTCQQCHKEATKGFTTFSPHANTHDFEKYPQVWIVTRFMWALLVGVFAFFWVHLGLWWYREAQDSKKRKSLRSGEVK